MKNKKGFIMLTMTLLLSAIAVLTVISNSVRTAAMLSMNDEAEYKHISLELAKACRNKALLILVLDPLTKLEGKDVAVASCTCRIISISASTTEEGIFEIKTSANVHRATTNMLTHVSLYETNLNILDSFEVAGFHE